MYLIIIDVSDTVHQGSDDERVLVKCGEVIVMNLSGLKRGGI